MFIRFALVILLSVATFLASGNAYAQPAPEFQLKGHKKTIKLSDYRGQIVYLDFWASWCQPCRKSFNWMNKMQALYGADGFRVIAINLDESPAKAGKFLKQIPANFEIAYDPQGNTARMYRVNAMPSSYLINKRGELVQVNRGFHRKDEDRMETSIRQLLQPPAIAQR